MHQAKSALPSPSHWLIPPQQSPSPERYPSIPLLSHAVFSLHSFLAAVPAPSTGWVCLDMDLAFGFGPHVPWYKASTACLRSFPPPSLVFCPPIPFVFPWASPPPEHLLLAEPIAHPPNPMPFEVCRAKIQKALRM